MKIVIVACLVLCMLSMPALAATEASAFTNSILSSYGSAFSSAKTISTNHITTPDIDFKSNGAITTELATSNDGNTKIGQNLYFLGTSGVGFGGYGLVSQSVEGTNVNSMISKMSVGGGSTVSQSNDNTKVESTSSGVGLANPGTTDYEFALSGGHNTLTTGGVAPVPIYMTDETSKEFSVTFEPYSFNLDLPADVLNEDVSVNFQIQNNMLAAAGYDFKRDMTMGDVSCNTEMDYYHHA